MRASLRWWHGPVLALLQGFWLLVAMLPRGSLGALATGGGWLYRMTARRQVRRLYLNLSRVYALPRHSYFAQLFARQVLRQQVLMALETLRAIRRPSELQVLGFAELQAEVQAAEALGRGHILITAHLGSWELCAYFAQKAASKPLHVLAKPAKQAVMTAFLGRLRAAMGTHVLWTERKTLLRDMLAALRRGDALGFVMDQKPAQRSGVVASFLGSPTEFVQGPEAMAAKTGCPLLAIFCVREGPLTYRLLSRTLSHGLQLLDRPADHQAAPGDLTAACVQAIEAVVRAYPEQWTWTYKRWREMI